MKRIITLALVVLLGGFSLNSIAQCTPNTSQTAFSVPDTATDFDTAYVNVAYDQVLYIAVPTDTTFMGFPTTIDSVVITGIVGLPTSISYSMNPASGIIHGGEYGCIQFTGTPTAAEIGNHPLMINCTFTATVAGMFDTIVSIPVNGYSIKVVDSSSNGIHQQEHHAFNVYQNSPNPFSNLTEIAFQSPGKEKITVEVFNISGQLVFSKEMISVQGYNSVVFDGSNFTSGVYVYKVSNGEMTVSKRMSLTKD